MIKICLNDTVNVIIISMKNKAFKLTLFLLVAGLVLGSNPVEAAKKRVWKASSVATTSTGGSSKFSVGAKLTGWKQYLNISFKGLSSTNGVTYELVYNGNESEQGVYGTAQPSEGNNITKSLFLGTCSHGACVSYKNISNMRLTITYKTKDGQTLTKKYKVKY